MNENEYDIFDRPIAFYPLLARLAGSVLAGVMLSQGLYWSKRSTLKDGFFWKTQEQWEEETCLTRSEQETARKKLLALVAPDGRRVWQEERRGVPAKLFFYVDRAALRDIVLHSSMQESRILECGNPAIKGAGIPQSITEITSENTADSYVSSEEDTLSLPFSDFPTPVAPVASPATKKKHAAPGPAPSRSSNEAKEIVKAYEKVLQEQTPGAIVAWPREVKAATAMVKAGWTEANVMLAYAHMKAQDYWQDKVLHLDKVAEQIATVWQTLKVKYPHLAPAMLKDEPYTIVWKLADGRIVEEVTTVSDAKRRGHYRS